MATGYSITLGYISGATFKGGKAEAWQQVKEIVAECREDPILIAQNIAMTLRNQLLPDMLEDELYEYIEIYRSDRPMTPISIDDFNCHILIMCSGGGESRIAKEIVARAFVLTVLRQCFHSGIDVSFSTD